jgi:multidrug efflux pump subunit AcrA (membrane-fusion protein)
MTRKILSAGGAIAVLVSLAGPVLGGASDYVFEPVKAEVKKGDDVVVSAQEEPTIAVPASAVIDSGTRQVVLVAKGEGRFEPRAVKLGRRGDGYVEVLDGISKGEEVVTAATFLIDAESNLRAALQAFTQSETAK